MVMLHYQIKGYDACSNMVANILPADPTHRIGSAVKIYDSKYFGRKGQCDTEKNTCE